MKNPHLFVGSFLIAILAFGCAVKGPILLSVGYESTVKPPVAPTSITVGVSPLRDERGKDPSLLGTRTIPNGMQNNLVVEGTVSDVVTTALKAALKARGLTVKDVPAWDLSEADIDGSGTAVVFGGEIKTLWLESSATSLKTTVKATVQLRIVAGDPATKKIIRTIDVNSSIEEGILYSRQKLEKALSDALSGALDQIFTDSTLKQKLS